MVLTDFPGDPQKTPTSFCNEKRSWLFTAGELGRAYNDKNVDFSPNRWWVIFWKKLQKRLDMYTKMSYINTN